MRLPSLAMLLVGVVAASPSYAQSDAMQDMDFIEHVAELQEQLDAEQVSDRDLAEAALLKLGPPALDHLDAPDDAMSLDMIERLARVRQKLETAAVRLASEASTVTLNGSLTVDQSLQAIQRQTTNDVALSGEVPIAFGQKKVTWDGKKISFWEAIDHLQQDANLMIDPYAGDGSTLRLGLSPTATPAANRAAKPPPKPLPAIQATADMFHVQVTRVDAARNLVGQNLGHVSLRLQIRWEPRLRPISLKLPAKDIQALGPDGTVLPTLNPNAVLTGIVQPQIPQLELVLPLQPIQRSIAQIESLTASLEAIVPGRVETFRFPRAGRIEPGKKIRRAGATVTLEGVDKNEDLFGATVSLEFDEEMNALESHQAWVFDNPVFLEDEEGHASQPLTYETIRQDNNRVALTYYFPEDPGERTLVYRTAAAILQTRSIIRLNNVPLP